MGNVWALPKQLYLVNYIKAWVNADISKFFLNTFMVVFGTLLLFFLMVTATSYVIAKYKFFGVKVLQGFYFMAMMIPSILVLVPLYFQLEDLKTGLTDNLITLMVVYAVQMIPVPIFLLVGFMKGINNSFIEAAVIDGAGEWYVFTKIVLPFVRPVLMFICLGNVMGTWNEYTTALTFLDSESNYTISIGLARLSSMFGYSSEYGAIFAGLTISLIPIIVLYILFQREIQQGTDISEGVK